MDVATSAMESVFGKTAKAWQKEAILHSASMHHSNSCQPLPLVRPTGDGKSVVRNTFAALACGVTITICPLLSLSADQCRKLQCCNQDVGPVAAFHSDEIRTKQSKEKLQELLLALPNNTNKTMFLFCSPQTLLNDNHWMRLIRRLIHRKLLRMFAMNQGGLVDGLVQGRGRLLWSV